MTSSAVQFRYLGICIGSMVCLVGTVGNMMTILAYATNPRMRTAFNLLIVNLAIIDFVLSTAILPVIIYGYSNKQWGFSTTSCEIFAYIYYALHYTSAVNLLAISFNRYMHVARPNAAYRIMFSKRKRRVAGIFIWTFGPICLLPLVFTRGFGWLQKGLMCAFTRQNGFTDAYSLVLQMVFQFLPLFGMIALYALIFHAVKKSHSNIDKRTTFEKCDGSQSNETKSVGMTSPGSKRRQSDYQLRLSHSATANTVVHRTPVNSPDDKRLPSPISNLPAVVSPASPGVQREPPTVNVVETNEAASSDATGQKNAVLKRNLVSTRHAAICRSVTSDILIVDPRKVFYENANVSTPLAKSKSFSKSRSVTFPDLIAARKDLPSCYNVDRSAPFQTRRSVRERPRSLIFKSTFQPPDAAVTPQQASLSVPGVKRSLSTSLSYLGPTKMRQRLNSVVELVRSKDGGQMSRRTSVQHAKAQRQLLYMSTVICAAFAFCALPSLILNLVGSYNKIEPEFFMAATNLGWLNSMINPIVYAAMNVQFRKEYSRIMQKVANFVWSRNTKVYPIKSTTKAHFSA